MKLNRKEKVAFAMKLKAMVDAKFKEAIESPKGQLSYLEVCELATAIEQECEKTIGKFPAIIKGACHFARALRNPDKMDTQEDLRKGFALLISTVGGLSIIWGVLSMANIGTALLVLVFGAHIPLFGPLVILGGLAAIVGAVYATISKQTPMALSAKAHDLLIEAISNWADEKSAKEKDIVAKTDLRRKVSGADTEVSKGSIVWSIVTWPFRTVAGFVDRPANADVAIKKQSEDEK
jgi:hypothetical protein